jgi:hypothetical protein
MRKLILATLLIIGSITCSAQRSQRYNSGDHVGSIVTVGGIAFSLAGFLTPPDYTWKQANTTGQYKTSAGDWVKIDFIHQGARSLCIVTGVTLTVCGLITMACHR